MDLDALKKHRGTVKASMTRSLTFVKSDEFKTASTANLKIRRTMVEDYFRKFDEYQLLIEDKVTTDPDLASQMTEREEFETKYLEIVTAIDEKICSTQQPVAHHSAAPAIRLPQLDIPTFSGKFEDWSSFRDLFSAIVHNNPKLVDAQKLQYLKGSLQGEASGLLRSMPVTDANYSEAWTLINKRYDNTRQIVNAHLKVFFAQQQLSTESSSSLRKLLDTSVETIRALRALLRPVDHWDDMIVHVLSDKLDPLSREKWESYPIAADLPTLQEFSDFVESRCRVLEALAPAVKGKKTTHFQPKAVGAHLVMSSNCRMCKENHQLHQCAKFKAMQLHERYSFVKKHSLCFNCLRSGHGSGECNSGTCRTCRERHHTLLHRGQAVQRPPNPQVGPQNPPGAPDVPDGFVANHSNTNEFVLLATAIVRVKDATGHYQRCRAMLDSCSQATFITEECAGRLHIKRDDVRIPVSGLGGTGAGVTRGRLSLEVMSTISSQSVHVDAYIMPKVSTSQPTRRISTAGWDYIQHLTLADPQYYQPGTVDILLGADVFVELLLGERIPGSNGAPSAMLTIFGWVLSGKVNEEAPSLTCSVAITSHLGSIPEDDQLRKFWEIEEVTSPQALTNDEQRCEEFFMSTTVTDPASGRYVVRLPFRDQPPPPSNSMQVAIRRLNLMESRLQGNDNYQQQYKEFMDEYLSLGHMEEIPPHEIDKPGALYLPHHFVLKDSSTTTKFRVVFDASARSNTGHSLNSTLLVGPKTQDDLVTILTRFRTHEYAFTADIAKMYRQILVDKRDTDYQRIVWRNSPDQPVRHFRLLTVTYGTACAPYIATKCLQLVAHENREDYPNVAKVIDDDFYVDDAMSGANSDDVLTLQKDLIQCLNSRGFQLRKWSSNHMPLLEALPEDLRETQLPLHFDSDDAIKALGILWNPARDEFSFKVHLNSSTEPVTKRMLLADTARLFDPLGWLSPTVLIAKILFQRLWAEQVGWDDTLPDSIAAEWRRFTSELELVQKLKIDRFTGIITPQSQIHGFSDASERAYGAVVYVRTVVNDIITVRLIASKTRVAPVKQVSLPRLELCGSVLLVRLVNNVMKSFKIAREQVHLWTDSTIVLAWLQHHSSRWKAFVANRVTEIQSSFPAQHWHHIPGKINPADHASRGLFPSDLLNCELWWKGPALLYQESVLPPQYNIDEDSANLELKPIKKMALTTTIEDDIINRFSSLTRMKRIIALCFRFIRKCQRKECPEGAITTEELNQALICIVKTVQRYVFPVEINCCLTRANLPEKSKLLSLKPFLDNGVLRVGGRLGQANLSPDQKHPIILPKQHQLTELIIRDIHLRNLHSGPQLTLATLLRRFWILGARSAIREHIHKCVICFRQRAAVNQQLMGDLPANRVQQSRPFLTTGVDYAGPFPTRYVYGRSTKTYKSYVALFVCFSTRAIHLELVRDLTTAAFIAALTRMVSRRGLCREIISDCGSNFIGARRELSELHRFLMRDTTNTGVQKVLAADGIKWTMNPPGSPHFGGLWEAGVKSTKHHLKRVMGNNILTYDEMTTLLTQVEACLNSRPLCAISTDPSDLAALTPGHFIIGEPLNAIPQPNLTKLKLNRLDRWQLVQRLMQHFWERWTTEFLSRLQQRPKGWRKTTTRFKLNDLVLIKDERQPPQKWSLGRIIELHPGKDRIVRVVTIKTATGIFKRATAKLCSLPFNDINV